MVHKTGSIMFFTVQDALRNRVESYLEIGERWRETVRGKVERHDTISVLLSMQRFTEKSQLSSSFERNSVIFSMNFLILCKKSTPRHLDGEMLNPKDISISIPPNLTYKRQGKHEHNHSALFPCLSYTQFR